MSTWLWILIPRLHRAERTKRAARRRPFRFQSLIAYLGVVWPRHRSEVERLVEDLIADAGVTRDVA